MKKKIIFRADGNATTGLGHLYRLFSLVEMVKDHFDFVFLTKEESTLEVIPKGYKVSKIPEHISINKEPKWINTHFPAQSHSIIADGYHFDSSYQSAIKQFGFKLMYIDDLATEKMYADIVINHSPYLKASDYHKQPYTQLALGTSYALLRPAFLEAAQHKRTINSIDTAFVCFGGADPFNLTIKAVKALLAVEGIKHIHVVLGGAYKHNGLIELTETHSKVLTIHRNLSERELVALMQLSQIGIAPASTILYELCCVKMPILSGYYVENQKYIYKGLAKLNVIYEGSDFRKSTIQDFELMIKLLLESPFLNIYLENQSKLLDGNSNRRVLGLINGLHVSFRKVVEKDMVTVFEWSNDNLVRQNSYNSDDITIEDHKKWFTNKINDEKSLFLIALVNNQPAGIVRYEINEEHSVIGIVVSKDYRGQGLATSFIKHSAIYYFSLFNKTIYAYIKKENQASIKSFVKARYKCFKDELIKGNLSFVYKLEKSDVER